MAPPQRHQSASNMTADLSAAAAEWALGMSYSSHEIDGEQSGYLGIIEQLRGGNNISVVGAERRVPTPGGYEWVLAATPTYFETRCVPRAQVRRTCRAVRDHHGARRPVAATRHRLLEQARHGLGPSKPVMRDETKQSRLATDTPGSLPPPRPDSCAPRYGSHD